MHSYGYHQYLSEKGGRSLREEYDMVVESISRSKLKSLAPEVAKLRAVKSEAEQRIMRSAADISGLAHAKVGALKAGCIYVYANPSYGLGYALHTTWDVGARVGRTF